MFCQKCGAENADDATFCNKCGAAMSGVATPIVQVVTTSSEPKKKGYTGVIVAIVVAVVLIAGLSYYLLDTQGNYAQVAVNVHSTHITEDVSFQILIDDEIVYTGFGLQPGKTYYPDHYFTVKFSKFVDSKIINAKVISTGGGFGTMSDSEEIIIEPKGQYTVNLYI